MTAGPPGVRYRFRKFVRRNRGQVLAASVVLLALVLGIAGIMFGLVRATRAMEAERRAKLDAEAQKEKALQSAEREAVERQKAEAARAEAQAKEVEANAVVKFFEDSVFSAGRPKGQDGGLGHDVSLRDAVRASLPVLATGFRDQPLVEARLRATLGITFSYLGDNEETTEQEEQARVLYTRYCGPGHPSTLSCMNNLANRYHLLGRLDDALKLREETLAIQNRVLSPDHPDTLRTKSNLAATLAELTRHPEALKLYEEALEAQKRVIGPDHADTLRTMNNLATSFFHLKRHDESLKLRKETLLARKRVLGPDHPETLTSMQNLTMSYRYLGRHAEALELSEETLAARKRVLPPDHPEILNSMAALAVDYAAFNRHAEALKLRQEALAARKRVLPPNHPHTLLTLYNLASSYAALNRHAEAIHIIDEFLAGADRPGVHPLLVPAAIYLRLQCCKKLGDLAGCRTTAEMHEKWNPTDAATLYNTACCRAVTASLQAIVKDSDAARLAQLDADRAMAWLQKAVAAGYKDASNMKKDSDLDFLREREDFRKLLHSLTVPRETAPVPVGVGRCLPGRGGYGYVCVIAVVLELTRDSCNLFPYQILNHRATQFSEGRRQPRTRRRTRKRQAEPEHGGRLVHAEDGSGRCSAGRDREA